MRRGGFHLPPRRRRARAGGRRLRSGDPRPHQGDGLGAGLKSIAAEARDLDRRPLLAADLAKVDVAVFDPPRAGAAAQAAQLVASRVARVVAVSCNPATFARDAAILIAGGLTLDRVQVVDQFLWSPHIELVAVFSRDG